METVISVWVINKIIGGKGMKVLGKSSLAIVMAMLLQMNNQVMYVNAQETGGMVEYQEITEVSISVSTIIAEPDGSYIEIFDPDVPVNAMSASLANDSNEGEESWIPAPVVVWEENDIGNKTGSINVSVPDGYDGYLTGYLGIELFKDNELFYQTSTSFADWANVTSLNVSSFLLKEIKDTGVYVVKVYQKDEDGKSISGYGISEEFNYVNPGVQLDSPQNVKWSDTVKGLLTWDKLDGAGGYYIGLRRDGREVGGRIWWSQNGTTNNINLSDLINISGCYTVTIMALSIDINVKSHSQWTDSDEYYTETTEEKVSNSLKNVLDGLEGINITDPDAKDKIATAVESVVDENDLSEMKIAMQTSDDVLKQIAELEELYASSNNIKVNQNIADEVGLDESKINIVGAALNADADREMSFSISKLDEKFEIPMDSALYRNTIQFQISLDGTIDNSTQLRIPVQITIPVPNGISLDRLKILHYHTDSSLKEIVTWKNNGDGTISFTVTDFSPFVFTEETVSVENIFIDISTSAWYYPAIQFVYDNGIMSGKGNGQFDPAGNLTRAEFVTTLYSMEEKPEVSYNDIFSDVSNGQWYSKPVLWANQNSIASGYGNGTFGVSDNITREQLAMMVYKYAEVCGYELEITEGVLERFNDSTQVSSWAVTAVEWAVTNGIISGTGDNRLNPQGNALRCECAAILKSFYERFGN